MYDLAGVGAKRGDRVVFRRNPRHFKDRNCMEARLAASSTWMLSHVAAEVAKVLSPMLLGPLYISG